MKGTLFPKVKVCCISSVQEAQLAINYGASALGLVSAMPSGPGVIDDEMISEIMAALESDVDTFLLTSKTTAEEIIEQHAQFNTKTIQIVDALKDTNYTKLREHLPNVRIVQVIHVMDETAIAEAKKIAPYVDMILLDSGNPKLKTKVLGGTGHVHNWNISKIIRQELAIPVFLAGGLKSANIQEAIQTVQAYGVDLCSGVRTNGKLDEQKLAAFFAAIKS